MEIEIRIVRDRIQFETTYADSEFDDQLRRAWEDAATRHIWDAGYLADVELGHGKDHHKFSNSVKIDDTNSHFWLDGKGDVSFYGPDLPNLLSDLENRAEDLNEPFDAKLIEREALAAFKIALQVGIKADEAGHDAVSKLEEEEVSRQEKMGAAH